MKKSALFLDKFAFIWWLTSFKIFPHIYSLFEFSQFIFLPLWFIEALVFLVL